MDVNNKNLKEWISDYSSKYDDWSYEEILNDLGHLDLAKCGVKEVHPDIVLLKGTIDLSHNDITVIPKIDLRDRGLYRVLNIPPNLGVSQITLSKEQLDTFKEALDSTRRAKKVSYSISQKRSDFSRKEISFKGNPIEKIEDVELLPKEVLEEIMKENSSRIEMRTKTDKFMKDCE